MNKDKSSPSGDSKPIRDNHLWFISNAEFNGVKFTVYVTSDKNPKGGFFSPKITIKQTYTKKDGTIKDNYADVQGTDAYNMLIDAATAALDASKLTKPSGSSATSGRLMIPEEFKDVVHS